MDQGLDKSIIREFAKLRVLATCRFNSMDELVQDLASALEESSNVQLNLKHWKRRERRRPSMKMGLGPTQEGVHLPSEDSASSVDKTSACGFAKSAQLTDSDGDSPAIGTGTQLFQKPRRFAVGSFVESDSVNENFSPVRPHRRKRKFKRMAVDPCSSTMNDSSVSLESSSSQNLSCRKGKLCVWLKHHHHCMENTCCGDSSADMVPVCSGKRKHSMRERSIDLTEGESISVFRQPSCPLLLNTSKSGSSQMSTNQQAFKNTFEQMDDNMYSLIESSSSLSSSESDTGVYTNDEGREGDDEQSDFYHEAGPACGIPGVKPWWESSDRLEIDNDGSSETMDATFQSILTGSFQHLSCEAKQAYKDGIQNMLGRKIRAGRRRVRDSRPGFSIVSSMNEKISKFLQDPEQNELKLFHMRKTEIDQLSHLASLYSLNVHTEGSKKNRCPVLTKTRNTTQATSVENGIVSSIKNWTLASDIKRRRRTPPVSEPEEAIPDTNIGNQILRNMGWEPGTGLGPTSEGRKSPITVTMRPKYQGLGFGASSTVSKPT